MSGATLYAFPTTLTAPVQQTRRGGRFPKEVISLKRIRRERDDKRSREQERQAKANETFREQVRDAMMITLADEVDERNVVGVVISAVDADGKHMGWAAGLFHENHEAGKETLKWCLFSRWS